MTDGRRCKPEWFKEYPFLTYNVGSDSLTCYTCCCALDTELMRKSDFHKLTFVSGFRNWKHAKQKIKQHASSSAHKTAAVKLKGASNPPVSKIMADATAKEQASNRSVFREVICTLRGLIRCGTAIRGHEETNGVLMTLLEERAETSREMKAWLKRRNNFLSHECQDELIKTMAAMILRTILEEARRSMFYGVIADGTTDITTKEQFSICVRYVTEEMVTKEAFLGLYELPGSTAAELYAALKDALQRTMYGMEKLRGYCFDGASNMSGRLSGVRARLAEDQPRSLYVHCANHSLDLALQEEAKRIDMVADALNTIREVTTILKTTKRKSLFDINAMEADEEDAGTAASSKGTNRHLLPLCPTRWTVRCRSIRRFLQEYDTVLKTLADVQNDNSASPDVRYKVRGYIPALKRFETLFGMIVCENIFAPCELFASALQSPRMNCGDVRKGTEILLESLTTRRESGFDSVWKTCEDLISKLDAQIEPPRQERPRKPPRRLEQKQDAAPPVALAPKQTLRKAYLETLDLLTSEVAGRFSQPALKQLEAIEDVLLGQNDPPSSVEELKEVLAPFDEDVNVDALAVQLACLRDSSTTITLQSPATVSDMVTAITNQGKMCRMMMSEVLKLASLVMSVPISGATAERSFKVLRRVKTYLRSTMHQTRLSNLVVLAVHRELAKTLSPDSILAEFVRNHPKNRVNVFGKI